MRPLPGSSRSEAHFEALKTLLRDRVSGRLATELRRYAENPAFMQHWDVSMRYSDGLDAKPAWIDRWHRDAKHAIDAMNQYA